MVQHNTDPIQLASDCAGISTKPMATVHSLPTEILEYIFKFGHASHDKAFDPRFVYKIPLVCQAWREVSISMPALWEHVFVLLELPKFIERREDKSVGCTKSNSTYSRTHSKSFLLQQILRRLQLSLERSGSRRLHLTVRPSQLEFSASPSLETKEQTILSRVLRILEPHLGRVCTTDITVTFPSSMDNVLFALSQSASLQLLMALQLTCIYPHGPFTWVGRDGVSTPPYLPYPYSSNIQIPELKMLTICATTALHPEALRSWSSLQYLTITNYGNLVRRRIDPTQLLVMLQRLKSLKQLWIRNINGEDPVSGDFVSQAIQFPKNCIALCALEELQLFEMPALFMVHFMKHIDAPCLRTLTMAGIDYNPLLYHAFKCIPCARFPSLTKVQLDDFCPDVLRLALPQLESGARLRFGDTDHRRCMLLLEHPKTPSHSIFRSDDDRLVRLNMIAQDPEIQGYRIPENIPRICSMVAKRQGFNLQPDDIIGVASDF